MFLFLVEKNSITVFPAEKFLIKFFQIYYVINKKIVFTSVKITASQMMRALEKFTIDESTGKATASLGLSFFTSMADPIDVYFKVWTYKNTSVNLGADGYPIEWTQGYYINYGN